MTDAPKLVPANDTLAQILDRLEKIDAALANTDRRIGEVDRKFEAEVADLHRKLSGAGNVLRAIGAETNGQWFLAGDVFRLAMAERDAAAANGDEEPDLSRAFREYGIGTSHGLARFLGSQIGRNVERAGEERGGVQWRVAVSN